MGMHTQRPSLVTEQRQKLSPRILQSLKVMAMPALELSEQIKLELETNPALEVLEDRSEVSLEAVSEAAMRDAAAGDAAMRTAAPNDEDPQRMFLEGTIAQRETLQEHLLGGLGLQDIAPELRALGERLIQNLDEDGFYTIPPTELCPQAAPEVLEAAVRLVRLLDPVGTCVADWRESLLFQASLDPQAPDGIVPLLRDHVERFEKGRLADVRKAMKLRESDFESLLAYLKNLNPFPGRAFSATTTRYIVPDLFIHSIDGELVITINDENFPVLGINPLFDELAAGESAIPTSKETAIFVRENIERARFFIGSIHQRNETLLNTAKAIVRHQRAFFTEGPRALVPLSLKDIAAETAVHETTISRVVNGKYAQTDRGIIELRRFFTNSISGAGSTGSAHSKESVKAIIKEIIADNERKDEKPLSDRAIMEALDQRGIHIARRTVAKYRSELIQEGL